MSLLSRSSSRMAWSSCSDLEPLWSVASLVEAALYFAWGSWWAVPAFVGAAIGVLDYETPILLPGYLLLWVLLFSRRVSDESVVALLRRTWWLFAGIVAISGLLSFRSNSSTPFGSATLPSGRMSSPRSSSKAGPPPIL